MKSLFLCLYLSVCQIIFAQPQIQDSTKVWNGKWNPKDPLCPCHEVQKQADEEYKRTNQTAEQQAENKEQAGQINSRVPDEKEIKIAPKSNPSTGSPETSGNKKFHKKKLKKLLFRVNKRLNKLFKKHNKKNKFSDECVFNFL